MTFKVFTIFAIGLLISDRLPAQIRNRQSPQFSLETRHEREKRKYKSMATVGGVLTVVGAGLLLVGSRILDDASEQSTYGYTTSSPNGGIYYVVAGLAFAGPGVPLFIVGLRNYRRLQEIDRATVGLGISPNARGLTLRCKF
jgi:hypothetical protein